jgi:hypothetical protein
MLRFCGLLTLALNTAGAIGHRQYGTALVDAVGPALLVGWGEKGPWLLYQISAVCRATAPEPSAPQHPEAAQRATPVLPARQPVPASWTQSTARRPAGPSAGTRSALICGSAAIGPAPWSRLSAWRRPAGPGRTQSAR